MEKPKELQEEISISAGAELRKQIQSSSSTEGSAHARNTKPLLHPPIETFWQLPPPKERKRSFTKMLSWTFKYMDPLRSMKMSQSTKVVLEGHHDPKDEKIVDMFREMLRLEGQLPSNHFDYHTLLRFLRVRDFDLMKAKDMYLKYIKWRQEYHVDTITKEFKFEEYQEVKKCYPHGFHGVDRSGRPIYIERLGMVDLNRFNQVSTIERFVKYHISEQEKTLNWRYLACSLAAKKHVASTVSILDVKNVGMSQFSKPARYLFMEIQRIDSSYYPETLHRLFIVNAGSRFKVLWKPIKAFLDARTVAKIRVLGTNYQSSLIEAIDPCNLPTFLGGDCMCSEFGGCLFSDKGPWNDPEITATLKTMLYTADDNQEGWQTPPTEKYASSSDTGLIQQRDPHNLISYGDEPLLQKIQAFEPMLEAAKEKIITLETVLEDTKLVLRGLAQSIEDMKR